MYSCLCLLAKLNMGTDSFPHCLLHSVLSYMLIIYLGELLQFNKKIGI